MGITSYYFDHEQNIVYEKFRGDISAEEFINHQREIAADPEFNPDYSILSDIRDATFNYDETLKRKLYTFMQNYSKQYSQNCKCAFITENPSEVV